MMKTSSFPYLFRIPLLTPERRMVTWEKEVERRRNEQGRGKEWTRQREGMKKAERKAEVRCQKIPSLHSSLLLGKAELRVLLIGLADSMPNTHRLLSAEAAVSFSLIDFSPAERSTCGPWKSCHSTFFVHPQRSLPSALDQYQRTPFLIRVTSLLEKSFI